MLLLEFQFTFTIFQVLIIPVLPGDKNQQVFISCLVYTYFFGNFLCRLFCKKCPPENFSNFY